MEFLAFVLLFSFVIIHISLLPFCLLMLSCVYVITTQALADENEFLRATALKAGQKLIHTFSDKSIEHLLPQLEEGILDENWRIRLDDDDSHPVLLLERSTVFASV